MRSAEDCHRGTDVRSSPRPPSAGVCSRSPRLVFGDLVLVEFVGDVDQDLDQERNRTAGGADVGHEQHTVARGLVDLDVVYQLFALEGVRVTGVPDRQVIRDGSRTNSSRPAPPSCSADPNAADSRSRRPVTLRDEMRVRRQYMLASNGWLSMASRNCMAFSIDAVQVRHPRAPPAAGRGRVRPGSGGSGRSRLRHIGLVERLGDLLLEILVEDVDHRPLPQRRQRLVGRLGRVHPHPRPSRVGHQPALQQLIIVGQRRTRGPHRLVLVDVGAVLQLLPQRPGGAMAVRVR